MVYLNLGSTAWVDVDHEHVITMMPHLAPFIREVDVKLQLENDNLLISSPSDANDSDEKQAPVFEHVFEEEIESSTEYSVSVWSRWL